jgi:zinc metalloprotease ZmpA
MSCFTLRAIASAAAALCVAGPALAAAPSADNAAVQRALGHLNGNGFQAAKASAADAFVPSDLVADADGANHVRFDRTHQGLRVIGGDLVVHMAASGDMTGLTQDLAKPIELSLKPIVLATAASDLALAKFGHSNGAVHSSELVIYARNGQPRLAYDVLVTGVRKDGTPSESHMIVDANSKKLLDRWDDIHTADNIGTGVTLYSGTVPLHNLVNRAGTTYKLKDKTRGKHYVVSMNNGTTVETLYKDSNNVWGNGLKSNSETAAADAAYGQNETWDYYTNIHGRNGIANDGKGARSRVHYSSNYDNAFWSDSCFCMTYGDGNFFNPLVSIDVAGHEMTHGVTSRTAKLIYSNESGGLNEATSDIFGTMTEFYANNANDVPDYDIGEEIYKTAGQALRYMNKPNRDGQSADCWYNGVGNIDVHYSSGVANHFFYLLAEGTNPTNGLPTSPTCVAGNTKNATGNGFLAGIGRAKAEKIWYRALTVYMTASETYAKARLDTISASNDLYGAGSAESLAVAAAWDAVNRP